MRAGGTAELDVAHVGRVAVVTLDRPERRNALTSTLIAALAASMAELDAQDDVAAVVLTGRDPAFCAGLDLGELSTTGANLRADVTGRPWPRLSKPVIGAVNGVAVTGGLELALSCDFVLASERARFADTHTRVGVLPGWGMSVLLPRFVGLQRAKEMSATGNYVPASLALSWGLVNHVVAHEDLLPRAIAIAEDVASNDQAALAALLELYDDNAAGTAADGLNREYEMSRAWRDETLSLDRVADRRSSIMDRGRDQVR